MAGANNSNSLHRIVVVGGGAGGLELVTQLGRKLGKRGKAHITLIEKARTHFWKPHLHEIAAGSIDLHTHAIDYLAQSHWHGFRYRFGEMIGLWCVDLWSRMGKPDPFLLVEFGPGRGTLMADALRAAKQAPDFLKAADIHLVEVNAALIAAGRNGTVRLDPPESAAFVTSTGALASMVNFSVSTHDGPPRTRLG